MKTFAPVLLLALCCVLSARAAGTDNGLKPESLRVTWSHHAFLNVNRNDVEAAFRALAETVGRRRGYRVKLTNEVLSDAGSLDAAVKRDAFELLIVDAWTYLAMNLGKAVTPRFIGLEQGKVGKQYLLLARRESGIKAVADLRDREIVLFEVGNTTLGRVWLNTLLLANGLGTHETFFNRVLSVGKPASAVLPVFFKKTPACVVDRGGFDVMTELNPQVGGALHVLAASEVLVDGFICLRNSRWSSETFKRDLVETLAELHREPAGQQLLSLLKASQLASFEEGHLATVRKLHAARYLARKEAKP